ncbi:MAG: DEAD/DEAH box helicase [Gemmatimonadetes bacterium]|nr:DEAD/DEAH box helicase [Gemmatimonadota bacterium]
MEEARSFDALGLSDARRTAIQALGWVTPTPIQWKAIPPALEGRDVVGIAQTGTGKTGAFMIASLERIREGEGLQVLILCPTRELALQVAEDAKELATGTGFRVGDVVGGVGYGPQIEALKKGYEIVTATPGRFNDHVDRGNVDLSRLRILILDEADRMLDMGFRPQIESVLRKSPKGRQTMLFSATMPNGVHALALQITKDPAWVEATPSGTTAEGIEEVVYTVRPDNKPELLVRLLRDPSWNQVLVFTRTKAGAEVLRGRLQREGIHVDSLHADRPMQQRTKALERFAAGEVTVLVATDVAQRGLDVEGISHVVNYDVPLDPEDYVHRIGRTGRAGAIGTAITFVTGGDLGQLKSIELRLGRTLERRSVPEFDYAGTSGEQKDRDRNPHSRSGRRIGTRSVGELTDEELAALLDHSR